MERLSLSIPPDHMSWLKAQAKRAGVTVGEIMRRLIEAARKAGK